MSTTGAPAVYLDKFNAFTASICILRPESKGHLELQADGSLQISPNYLSTPGDQALAVRSLEIAREVSNTLSCGRLGLKKLIPQPRQTSIMHVVLPRQFTIQQEHTKWVQV